MTRVILGSQPFPQPKRSTPPTSAYSKDCSRRSSISWSRGPSVRCLACLTTSVDSVRVRCFHLAPNLIVLTNRANLEAHIPTQSNSPRAHSRLPIAHEDRRRQKGAGTPPRQGPSPARAARQAQVVTLDHGPHPRASHNPWAESAPARFFEGDSGWSTSLESVFSGVRIAAGRSGSGPDGHHGHSKSRQRRPAQSHQKAGPRMVSTTTRFDNRTGSGDHRAAGFSRRGQTRRGEPRSGRGARPRWVSALLATLAVLALRAYQLVLSPWFGGACRFYPSCSEYAVQSVEKHGPGRGLRQTLRRLARCHPFSRGGLDLP